MRTQNNMKVVKEINHNRLWEIMLQCSQVHRTGEDFVSLTTATTDIVHRSPFVSNFFFYHIRLPSAAKTENKSPIIVGTYKNLEKVVS